MLVHAIAVAFVAGTAIERPGREPASDAIAVTLLGDRDEEGVAGGAEAPIAPPPAPAVVPDPPPRGPVVAKPLPPRPAPPAPAVAPEPAASPPVERARGAEARDASDASEEASADSGAATLQGPAPGTPGAPASTGSGGARPYGEHDVDLAAGPIAGIRRPSYPARERMLGREGRVSLLVTVDPTGAVHAIEVTRSAGEAFDAAARRAVEATPFRPAERRGVAVASTVTVNVSFELD